MTLSARLEIHQINVGQGDSVLIVNRDLDKVKAKIQAAINSGKPKGVVLPADPIDYVPYAVFKEINLEGTINRALVIDGGDDDYGGDVYNYLQRQGALRTAPAHYCPDLYMLISHPHDDHLAGLRSIFKQKVEVTKVVNGKKQKVFEMRDHLRPACVYHIPDSKKTNPTTLGFKFLSGDIKRATNAPANKTKRVLIHCGGLSAAKGDMLTIDLGVGVDAIPVKLYALAADQGVYLSKGQATKIKAKGKGVDQNDRSIVLILEYGSFRYFLGGDIAGTGTEEGGNKGDNIKKVEEPKKKKKGKGKKPDFSSQHADVETSLGAALETFFPATTAWKKNEPKYPAAGYCTVMKANHHGSASSCDVYLMATLRPCVAIISSGVKARYQRHPTQAVINRMSDTPKWGLRPDGKKTTNNTIKQVYVTEVADKFKGEKFEVNLRGAKILGDIVIRPVDESIRTVHASTTRGQEVKVQIYGSGEQTGLASANSALRGVEAKGATDAYTKMSYIGPFYHTDKH
jgi:beta-lactamase superfamily II metal-dependent hydrolase